MTSSSQNRYNKKYLKIFKFRGFMRKFEYKVSKGIIEERDLEMLGKDGWELCGVLNFDNKTYYSYFKREISDIDYSTLLISCSYMRNIPNLQHRTISEFAQFMEDVMSGKDEYKKYLSGFDFNKRDAIEIWIQKFYDYCKESYGQNEEEFLEFR